MRSFGIVHFYVTVKVSGVSLLGHVGNAWIATCNGLWLYQEPWWKSRSCAKFSTVTKYSYVVIYLLPFSWWQLWALMSTYCQEDHNS